MLHRCRFYNHALNRKTICRFEKEDMCKALLQMLGHYKDDRGVTNYLLTTLSCCNTYISIG